CRIAAQELIGACDDRAVLRRARRLHHRCGAVIADGAVEIEDAIALSRRPAAVSGELRKRIGKLRLVGSLPRMIAIPGEGVDKLCKRQASALETIAKGAAQNLVLFAHQSEFAVAMHGRPLNLTTPVRSGRKCSSC